MKGDTVSTQVYLPIVISQPVTSAPAARAVPPIIRLLDNEGKLTHIAVAENGSYKLYRVNEGSTNSAHIQAVNQTATGTSGELKVIVSPLLLLCWYWLNKT